MKKILSLLIISFLLMSTLNVDAANLWSKYVANDKSYSIHYPSGWTISANESIIAVDQIKNEEQLVMAMIPFDQLKSPKDLANNYISLLKNDNPNIKVTHWQYELEDEQVVFHLTNNRNGKIHSGLGIVIKSDQNAIWFSYFAPSTDYYQVRGAKLLQGFMASLASGSDSKAPNTNYNVDTAKRIDKNAKAFLFTLEFSLGIPFTKAQEDKIVAEIKDSWRYLSEEELKVYDQYPGVVKTILKVNQKDLEELRSSLEDAINEWLDETDKSDPVVKIIQSQLKAGEKTVIKGKTSLTERSLNAYSELIAYSWLLQTDNKAKPDQISKTNVNSIKKQVKKEWKTFSDKEKKSIATSSGIWFCMRAQFHYGTKKDQNFIRTEIKKLTAAASKTEIKKATKSSKNNESGYKKPIDMGTHMAVMQIQQNMFNHYRWLRGYTSY